VYVTRDAKAETVYSFDGRYHATTKTPRFTDDEKFFFAENGIAFLKAEFAKRYAHLNVFSAYIADSDYNNNYGQIDTVLSDGHWTSQEVANRRLHEGHQAARAAALPSHYTFRLSLPRFKNEKGEVKWKNLYTKETLVGYALRDLIAQYRKYTEGSPLVRFQEIGQIYGQQGEKFAIKDLNAPRVGYFETKNCMPRYHRTDGKRGGQVIEEYAQILASNQEFEELISNYTA
jgi:hypothetical protein